MKTLENNMTVLFSHIVLSIIVYYVGIYPISLFEKYNQPKFLLAFFVIIIGLYFCIGRLLLKPESTSLKYLASVSALAVVGLILTFSEVIANHGHDINPFLLYFTYASPIDYILQNHHINIYIREPDASTLFIESVILFFYSLIPTISMWLGLQWKSLKIKQK